MATAGAFGTCAIALEKKKKRARQTKSGASLRWRELLFLSLALLRGFFIFFPLISIS